MGRGSLIAFAACAAITAGAQAADLSVFYRFLPLGPGQSENPHVRGSAVLVTDDLAGVTHCIMSIGGLQPNTEYGVRIGNADTGSSVPQAFTTASSGRASFSVDIPGFITADMNPEYTIYRWDGQWDDPNTPEPDFDLIWDVTASEVRAGGLLLPV
jgi:hypothetical protein